MSDEYEIDKELSVYYSMAGAPGCSVCGRDTGVLVEAPAGLACLWCVNDDRHPMNANRDVKYVSRVIRAGGRIVFILVQDDRTT